MLSPVMTSPRENMPRPTLDKPRIYVDFNEMVDGDLVLLSIGDTKCNSEGASVLLSEGLAIDLYMDDEDVDGRPDPLIARGVVEATAGRGWAPHVKWCCRIAEPGVRHLSQAEA